ncbi:MAG: hypothetical protein H7A23_16830 [Leptospiraceae bacterium]|nr:hypothetical protein [Leptospiraceae bacterium]MCP5496212.1 hypothetical protein [Leptospiraceae bacterium]
MKLLSTILLVLSLSSCISYNDGKLSFDNGTCKDGEYMSKCGSLLWVCLFGVPSTSKDYSSFTTSCMMMQASCAAKYDCESY